MPVRDHHGTVHHGYQTNDGHGKAADIYAMCQYVQLLRGQMSLALMWTANDVIEAPVDCMLCLGEAGGFARGHSRWK